MTDCWTCIPNGTRVPSDWIFEYQGPIHCPSYPLNVWATNADGSAIDTALFDINWTTGSEALQIYATDRLKAGSYPIKIWTENTTLGNKNTIEYDFTIDILDPCGTATLTININPLLDDSYKIHDNKLTKTIDPADVSSTEVVYVCP